MFTQGEAWRILLGPARASKPAAWVAVLGARAAVWTGRGRQCSRKLDNGFRATAEYAKVRPWRWKAKVSEVM